MPAHANPHSPIFGQRLRQLRNQSELSQEKVGVMIGLEESSARARISRYETGEHDPSEATALKIAEVFGVPLAYLFTPDQRLGDIIRCYDRMDEAGRARLAELAATLVASSDP
ncbi:MAG: XRE family transcriptional regulator [Gammaproteobacteria bacterium]|nr:XRE family transcriptional regulator [Gammaproteobacteria bacterium]